MSRAFWPLVPGRRSCRPCRRCRGRRASSAPVAALGGLQVVDLDGHGVVALLDRDEVGTWASIPRISGRSGRVFDWPMRPRPRARSVPRCLGLVPMADRVWVTVRSAGHHATSSGTCGPRRAGSPGRREQALGHELLGVEAPEAGDLVGPLERLEAGDRGAGHVDVVGRAERLAQHVVDARPPRGWRGRRRRR